MTKIAKRTDPALWELCKAEALNKMGKFSARAMQYAVKLYKERGGEYVGGKTSDNSLVKWTKEDWGYVGEEGHSRYLPKKLANIFRREKSRQQAEQKILEQRRVSNGFLNQRVLQKRLRSIGKNKEASGDGSIVFWNCFLIFALLPVGTPLPSLCCGRDSQFSYSIRSLKIGTFGSIPTGGGIRNKKVLDRNLVLFYFVRGPRSSFLQKKE